MHGSIPVWMGFGLPLAVVIGFTIGWPLIKFLLGNRQDH